MLNATLTRQDQIAKLALEIVNNISFVSGYECPEMCVESAEAFKHFLNATWELLMHNNSQEMNAFDTLYANCSAVSEDMCHASTTPEAIEAALTAFDACAKFLTAGAFTLFVAAPVLQVSLTVLSEAAEAAPVLFEGVKSAANLVKESLQKYLTASEDEEVNPDADVLEKECEEYHILHGYRNAESSSANDKKRKEVDVTSEPEEKKRKISYSGE